MPTSDKQLAANRANAQKSTGPKTPAGKRSSSRNALRHGLFAKAILIDGESPEVFKQLLTALEKEFRPETPTEIAMVDNLAAAQWRRVRLWTLESAGLIHQMRRQAAANSLEDSPTRAMLAAGDPAMPLDRIRRYETGLDRQHHRALHTLMRLRDEKNARAKATQFSVENKRPDA
jgi:hypothetical protein